MNAHRLIPRLAVVGVVLIPLLGACTSSKEVGSHARELTSLDRLSLPSADLLEERLRGSVESAVSVESASVSPRLLEMYLSQSGVAEVDSALVWQSYRSMLSSAASYADDTSRAHLLQHLALSELLYAEEWLQDEGLEQRAERALSWWVDRETAPATGINDRLMTHLSRVELARQQYPSASSRTGLDARGETLVRYGSPTRVRQVSFNEPELLQAFLRDGLPVRPRDFPSNEFWLYDQLGHMGMFLFVSGPRETEYELGSVNDLVPRQLRSRGVSGSSRGDRYAMAALRTMRHVFSQLSLFHPLYGGRYSTVSDYVSFQEERAFTRRGGGRQHTPVAGQLDISRTLESAISRNESEDRTIRERRSAALPIQYAGAEVEPLPVSVRTVRRVADDGSTSVMMFWRTTEAGRDACIRASNRVPRVHHSRAVAYEERFSAQRAMLDHTEAADDWERVYRHEFELATRLDEVAIQLDGFPDGYHARCSGAARTGPLEPIDLREAGVALSDLLPFEVEDVVDTRRKLTETAFSLDQLTPYFDLSVAGQEAVGVYFEVYAGTDLDDRYMLEYEVVQRMPGAIFRRGSTRTSIYQARQARVQNRLPAAFLVDRSEWAGAEAVELIVTVTNLETDVSVQRSLSFTTGLERR